MESQTISILVVAAIVAVIAGKYIVNWHHEIQKRNRYLEAQIRLLEQIATIQGVDEQRIKDIIADAELPPLLAEWRKSQEELTKSKG